jgi:hypothetical protein
MHCFFKERGKKALTFYFDKKGANMGGLGHERKTKLPKKSYLTDNNCQLFCHLP